MMTHIITLIAGYSANSTKNPIAISYAIDPKDVNMDEIRQMPIDYFRSTYVLGLDAGPLQQAILSHMNDTVIRGHINNESNNNLFKAAAVLECVESAKENHFPRSGIDDCGLFYTIDFEVCDQIPPGLKEKKQFNCQFGILATELEPRK